MQDRVKVFGCDKEALYVVEMVEPVNKSR